MEIRDSVRQAKARRNNTVLELQWQFDEQKKQEAHRQQLIWAAVALVFLLFIIMLLVLYIRYRRAKERIVLTEQQMQINSYINEIAQLKRLQTDTNITKQIEELNSKIRELDYSMMTLKRTAPHQAGRTTTTNASSTTIRPSTSLLTVASKRNMPPRPPTTPSSSSSMRWDWKTATSAASWASRKRPSAPQGTESCRMERSREC